MRLFKRATTGSGQAAKPTDLEVIRAKLATVEQEIADASTELDRLALRSVLADDNSASDATARLDELRHRRDLLIRALAAGERAEREAAAALHAREHQARKRALSQHLGRLERDASDVSAAL